MSHKDDFPDPLTERENFRYEIENFLEQKDESKIPLTGISEYLSDEYDNLDSRSLQIRLHHVDLPAISKQSNIDYDWENHTVIKE